MENEVDPEVRPFRAADYPVEAAFLNRWSPRAFSPEPVDDETLMSVFEAARWATSSYNEQPWRFLVARTDEDRRTFLDFLMPANRAWAQNAPVLLLIITKNAFSHNGAPNKTAAFDAGTCSGYLTLQASLHGLITHGMVGFNADAARAALSIPEDFELLAVYALGRRGDRDALPPALQEREQPSGRRPVRESFMEGGFRPTAEAGAEGDTVNTDS